MALAHVVSNKVETAYRRSDLISKRNALMQDWADFIQAVGRARLERRQTMSATHAVLMVIKTR